MTYLTAVTAAVSLVIGVCLIGYVVRVTRVWRRLKSERVVTCPETGHPAAVRIDVVHAAVSELAQGELDLRLASCSRWPSRGPCDEACMLEAQDPQSTVQAIAAGWYKDKVCIYCRGPLGDDRVSGHHAAFLDSSGVTREWADVPADALPEALSSGWPVCWDCHVAATFRRTHPQFVTDRSNLSRLS